MVPKQDAPHTAVTTWSGFIYQGKVALYHTLTIINDNPEYQLQLDSLEDFAILDNAGELISVHQVKALKSQNFSSYKAAFKQLKEKSDRYGCEDANFHVAREITDETTAQINDYSSPVTIYPYGADTYCAVNEIDYKIETELKKILAIFFEGDPSKQTDDYVIRTRGYLDQIILKKVLAIHRIVHENLMSDREAAYSQVILFRDLIEILQQDLNQENLGDDYYYYQLLNDFHRYYQEYCIDNEAELTEEELKKLSLSMKDIGGLDKEEMVQFIRGILPHREFKFKSLQDYKDHAFDKEGIQQAFLTILHELKEPEYCIGWNVNEETYSPTTINTGQRQKSDICRRIIENVKNTDLVLMFEGRNLITTDIDVDSIFDAAPKVTHDRETENLEHDRIIKGKKLSLICLDNAKGIIND